MGFFAADALIGLCAYRDNEIPHPNFFPGVTAKISSKVRSLRSRETDAFIHRRISQSPIPTSPATTLGIITYPPDARDGCPHRCQWRDCCA